MRRYRLALLVLLALVAAGYAGRHALLKGVGSLLTESRAPEDAEIVVVLAGDGHGRRIMRAAEIVKQGYAPRVLVDGSAHFYDLNEADAAIGYAVRQGAPREIFDPFPITAKSTFDEARLVDRELVRRGVRKALVVTSDYHTRRARTLFEQLGSGKVKYVFVAAADEDFKPENWWRRREGLKTVLLEYLKTFYSWFEVVFCT